MASKKAVAMALGKLSANFAGKVDEERVRIFYDALQDVEDEQLLAAVVSVILNYEGEFIPPVAIVRKAAKANAAPAAVDAAGMVRQIEKLATYNPNVGMIYPHVSTVRDKLGDLAAYAYAAAGATRLFSDNEVSRDIATREFQKAAEEGAQSNAHLPIIGLPDVPRISS